MEDLHFEGEVHLHICAREVNVYKPADEVHLEDQALFVPLEDTEESVANNAWQFGVLEECDVVDEVLR